MPRPQLKPSIDIDFLRRYGVALLTSALALLLTWLLLPIMEQNLFLICFAAVVVSAWYGGLVPGLLTTAVSVLIVGYLFIPPTFSLNIGVDGILRMGMFTLVAVLTGLLTEMRRRGDLAEREQRERLRVTLASIGDGVIATDAQGRVTFINSVASTLTGWSPEEVAGRTVTTVFPIVNEQTRTPVENPVVRVIREGVVAGLANQTILIARDGTERPIDDSGAPIRDSHGNIIGAVLVFRDITERKRADEELRQSRDQLAIILGGVADGITVQDQSGRLIYANDSAAQLTGYSSAQALLEAPVAEIMRNFQIADEAGRPFPLDRLPGRLALQGVQSPDVTLRFRAVATGEERWSIVKATPAFDERGKVQLAINFFQDITELKRAELVHAQLAAIVESSNDAIIGKTLDGIILSWNAGAERLYGYTTAEMIGRPIAILVPPDRPDELPQILDRLKQGERISHYETVRVRNDGTHIYVSLMISPIKDAAGVIVGASTIARDITERKQAEEERARLLTRERLARAQAESSQHRFALLAAASSALASSLDYATTLASVARLAVPDFADWCIVDVVAEDGSIHQTAVAHADPTKLELIHELRRRYPPDADEPHAIWRALRTGQSELVPTMLDSQLMARAHDAQHLRILRELGIASHIVVPLVGHQRTLGVISFVVGQSSRRYGPDDLVLAQELARRAALAVDNARLYEAERRARAEAQEAVRLRDVFLSIASHELKTPLTTLLGSSQLLQRRTLRDGTLPERDQRTAGVIVEQASRLNKMIGALLDVSRIEMGQLSIERAPVDLCALARRVVEEVQPALDQHTVICESPDTPLLIEGDALRLEQVLQNLIQNAVKYSPVGGFVRVLVDRQDTIGHVSVSDHGIGIPQAALPQLFQRFYRAANADEQHISGLGVGLYVVKEIVALHGGTVSVESVEGQGSTFTVSIPLLEPMPDPHTTPGSPASPLEVS